MKSYLQLNLDSPFNKNYYRTRRNKLELTKENVQAQYTFDNICYTPDDINSSIAYDIVIDYSSKEKIGSSASINLGDSQPIKNLISKNHHQESTKNLSSTLIEQDFKQPDFSYVIIFDQIVQSKSIESFIKEISGTQIFKKEKIKIGHFLAHENGIYDFHRKKVHLSETQRQQLQRQYTKLNGSIEDNFMWMENKEISLCEEVKLSSVSHLVKSLSYISFQEFNQLPHPSLGVQLASNLTKAEQIKHKQLQNKKILQVFVVNIGNNIRIVLLLLNYNKNYQFNADESKELSQLFMMYGVVQGKIKYQTIKVQIINVLMKNAEKLYYVMYFPGPKLSIQQQSQVNTRKSSLINSPLKQNSTTITNNSNINPNITNITNSSLFRKYSNTNKLQNSLSLSNSRSLHSSKIGRTNSPQRSDKLHEHLKNMFYNYTSLKNKDKDSLQKIIKEYLIEKEDNLKAELEKIKDRVKDLKLSQRIEESEVSQLKIKCTKALEKMSQSIVELQNLGITNVERHMDWLKSMVDDKKQQIRQVQQQIQQINRKTIQNRKSHQYFYEKMQQFRDRLKQKHDQITKQQKKQKVKDVLTQQIQQKQNTRSHHKSYLNILSLGQLEELEHHKEKLKAKLVDKLKNSHQKKYFVETLAQIRGKVGKLELTRLEQKYFDLLHD